MRTLDALRARLSRILFRSRAEARVEEEFRFHVEMETEANLRRGMPPAEARRQALIAFGGLERHRERMREGRGAHAVERAVRDLRHASRALLRAPAFSLTAVFTLALGTGAVTATFTLVDRILIRPLPYPDADRLVALEHAAPGLGLERTGLSSGTYFHYRERATTLEGVALYTQAVVNVSGGEQAAERVELALVSPEFFDVLGVQPALGRTFSEEEVAANDGLNLTGVLPVLLSHDLWRQRFGGDPSILDATIDVNARARRVVGVLPAGFAFPRATTDIWLLAVVPARTANLARGLDYEAVARLVPGVGAEAAQDELARVLPSIVGTLPDATPARFAEVGLRPVVTPLKRHVVGRAEGTLWTLLGSMALLLLASCANVANLCLARSQHRLKDVSVRTALGASRGDVARVFLAESALLATAGAGLGVLLATATLALLVRLTPVELPRLDEVHLDPRALLFAAALALLATLLVALGPILRHTRPRELGAELRSAFRGTTPDRQGTRLRRVFVAAQVALAFTLLAGSLLLGRSFTHLVRVDPGFDPEGVLVVEMGLPGSRAPRHHEIFTSLLERVRALPGVVSAAGAGGLPLSESVWTAPLRAPLRVSDRPAAGTEALLPVAITFFMPGYFQVMRTPVLEGAAPLPGEPPEAPNPVVISAALARRLFPGESALGRRIRRLGDTGGEITYGGVDDAAAQPDYVVAGVVADVRARSLREAPAEVVYIPVTQPPVDPGFSPTEMSLVIRASVPPLLLAPEVRGIVRDTDPVLGVARVRTLDDVVSASFARERFLAVVLLVAGAASLLLGAVGVYGVVGYLVRQRTQELGIRVALGARSPDVVRDVLRDSLPMVLAGAAGGLLVALLGERVLGSLLFGVRPGDPLTLAAALLLVLAAAGLAIGVPALRAARVDPALALRAEG